MDLDMATATQAAPTSSRPCCSSWPLPALSKHETAKVGNTFGIAGMAVALVATVVLAHRPGHRLGRTGVLLVIATGGRRRGRPVAGAGGRDDRDAGADRAAALLRRAWLRCSSAGTATCTSSGTLADGAEAAEHFESEDLLGIHSAEVVIGVFIGAVTFTGSIVAFLKLSARIKSSPLMLPGKNALNLGALVAFVGAHRVVRGRASALAADVVTLLALLLGWHLVASIGGGDMPVVVSACSTATPAGRPPHPASCWATTC